jgi:aminocarboxymuconate-semialdehyde decarboxylase
VDLVFADVRGKFPSLKLIFAHGGGVASTLLARCSHGWRTVPAVRNSLGADPLVVARNFFFDTLVYDRRALQHLVEIFGAARLLAGSDFPFAMREPRPGQALAALAVDDQQRSQMRRDTAARLFGIDSVKRAPAPS